MNPLTDFDRALREAMRVEPGGDFAARIRARVAAAPRESRVLVPRFGLVAVGVLLAVIVTGVWRETETVITQPMLPHRDLIVLSQPPRVVSSPAERSPRTAPEPLQEDVVVSRSEMLALQRLFSGLTVAPPSLPAPADELSIPELAIAPLLAGGPEGERQ